MGGLARRVVDLDAVLDGELVEPSAALVWVSAVVVDAPPPHRLEDSPLFGRTVLGGRIVTDPVERAEIAARIAAHRRSRWGRVVDGLAVCSRAVDRVICRAVVWARRPARRRRHHGRGHAVPGWWTPSAGRVRRGSGRSRRA